MVLLKWHTCRRYVGTWAPFPVCIFLLRCTQEYTLMRYIYWNLLTYITSYSVAIMWAPTYTYRVNLLLSRCSQNAPINKPSASDPPHSYSPSCFFTVMSEYEFFSPPHHTEDLQVNEPWLCPPSLSLTHAEPEWRTIWPHSTFHMSWL